MGRPVEAIEAHRAAILLSPGTFADLNLEQRLNFYLSASQTPASPNEDGSGQAVTPIQAIISAFEEAQSRYPGNLVVIQTLGQIYSRLGDQQKAVDYFQQAAALGDNSVQTAMAIADAYLNTQDYEGAANAYQRVLQSDPQNVQAHSNLGYLYAQMGRIDEAIQANLQVLQLAPDDYISQRNLVLLYRDTGQLDEAIKQAKSMIEVTPENELGNTYLLLGSLYESSAKPLEAIEAYEQATAAVPGLYQAQVALAIARVSLHRAWHDVRTATAQSIEPYAE